MANGRKGKIVVGVGDVHNLRSQTKEWGGLASYQQYYISLYKGGKNL